MREWEKQLRETQVNQIDLLKSANIVTGITKYPYNSEKKGVSSHSGSRRSSRESLEFGSSDVKELQQRVNECDSKLKETMVSNAQLEREKQCYSYEIDTLKDDYQDLEETYIKLQKDYKDKSRNFELLKRDFAKLKDENTCLEECMKQRDQLIKENGLRVISSENGDECIGNNGLNGLVGKPLNGGTLISREASRILNEIQGETLEDKLRYVAKEKCDLLATIKQLRNELREEKERNEHLENSHQMVNGDVKQSEAESNKLIHEYKFKLLEAEKERNTLQNTIIRLETQLDRTKQSVEDLEKSESEVKMERRKIGRELREAQGRIEELEASNTHLQKRIDKLMSSRLANLNSDS